MIAIIIRIPKRRKPTLRDIGRAVAVLQVVEGMALHAERDGCLIHGLAARGMRASVSKIIPARYLRDSEWVHRHIEAPGMRLQAKVDDEVAS